MTETRALYVSTRAGPFVTCAGPGCPVPILLTNPDPIMLYYPGERVRLFCGTDCLAAWVTERAGWPSRPPA